MKTLINKANPSIRITAPEIEICDRDCIGYYYVGSVGYCVKDRWTLVEEEPTCKESLQVEPKEGIRGKKEEIPSNVDLEKEYKEYIEGDPVLSKLTNRYAGLIIARHFYKLGLNTRKEE